MHPRPSLPASASAPRGEYRPARSRPALSVIGIAYRIKSARRPPTCPTSRARPAGAAACCRDPRPGQHVADPARRAGCTQSCEAIVAARSRGDAGAIRCGPGRCMAHELPGPAADHRREAPRGRLTLQEAASSRA